MSAPCEPLDAMVVSETGEMESPRVEPARIAPISTAGTAATAPPAGYNSGPATRIVPKLVPVAVDTSAQITNAAATYAPPVSPVRCASCASATMKPLAPMIVPSTPAKSHAQSMIITTR